MNEKLPKAAQTPCAWPTPWEAAQELAALLPSGPVLELCCGVGGATRALAQGRRVLAVDRYPARLGDNQANMRRLGLDNNVDYFCCDLTRPALLLAPGRFASAVLAPDWSPQGCGPHEWTDDLALMCPPAHDLVRWPLGICTEVFLRLPPGFKPQDLEPGINALEVYAGSRKIFRLRP